MESRIFIWSGFVACVLFVQSAIADEPVAQIPNTLTPAPGYRDDAQKIVDRALGLIGIRYHRGGDSPVAGFDCSGFVGNVFREGLGLVLPRSSHELSETGTVVSKDELAPGDLVFFKTMRHAFSHVGIYLGDHLFIHAPRTGEVVGVADIRDSYWAKRYNGARRIAGD